MPSDLCMFDESLFLHSSPGMVPSDSDMNLGSNSCLSHFQDPLLPNRDIDFDDPDFLDQFIAGSSLGTEYGDFSGLEVKDEEFQMGLGDQSLFSPRTYENVAKSMQRSFSSNYFGREMSGFCFQTQFESIGEAMNVQNQALRKVCSTGDLQNTRTIQKTEMALSSSFMEESSFDFKVGRYSAEEKKRRILKYRAKRNQRNFNKKIKYACRKTLADNRPRIRGRFARNDDADVIPKASSCTTRYQEDEFSLDGFVEVERDQGQGALMSHYGQLQYYGY